VIGNRWLAFDEQNAVASEHPARFDDARQIQRYYVLMAHIAVIAIATVKAMGCGQTSSPPHIAMACRTIIVDQTRHRSLTTGESGL
jgi:hypothetical protein